MSLRALNQALNFKFAVASFAKEKGYRLNEANVTTLVSVAILSKEKSVTPEEINRHLKDNMYPFDKRRTENHLDKLSRQNLIVKEGRSNLRFRLSKKGEEALNLLEKILSRL